MSDDLSFKEKLVYRFASRELSGLEDRIQHMSDGGYREMIFTLTSEDFTHKRFSIYRDLTGYGKLLNDKLISLGFKPELQYSSDRGYIKIKW